MINNYTQDEFRGISPTKQSIRDYIRLFTNCSHDEMVDEFSTLRTRHICSGSKNIIVLDKSVIPVLTTKGMVNVEVFLCPKCRKLLLSKESMEI